jgi:uncharacterized protein (UPF0332 family)
MTDDAKRRYISDYWMGKADAALASAASELVAVRLDFAVNRAYYACFYAASAVLLESGHKFVKHSGVRAAVHRHLVKAGMLEAPWGKAYDRLFEARQAADYLELVQLEPGRAAELIALAQRFVAEMKRLRAASDGR